MRIILTQFVLQLLLCLLTAQARIVNRGPGGINVVPNQIMDGIQGSNPNIAGASSTTNSIRVMGNVLPSNLERKSHKRGHPINKS